MLFVHEMHSLSPSTAVGFEAMLRDRWAPALGRDADMRLVWCVRSMPGAFAFPEIITLTAVADGAALERLGDRLRDGDLRQEIAVLDGRRARVETRILAPLTFNPLVFDLDSMPSDPGSIDRPGEIYIHDLVPPRLGAQRAYEVAMGTAYMRMQEMEGLEIRNWAGLETVPGGGPVPENLMLSHISSARAGTDLLFHHVSRDEVKPGSWLSDALKLRDTWVSRLVRTVPWSPLN